MSYISMKINIQVLSWIVLFLSFYRGHTIEPQSTYLRSNDHRELLDSIYTTSPDFSLGAGINVNCNGNQVQLNSAAKPFEFVWVIMGRNTVVKIDTNTGIVLGGYLTAPERPGYGGPNRIAVDLDGSVWVGNGEFSQHSPNYIVHIGLKENNQCKDRNNNGIIDTSTGLNAIKNWAVADLNTADDECIIYYRGIRTTPALSQMSVNDNNNVWLAGAIGGLTLIKGGGPTVPGSGNSVRQEWRPLSIGGITGIMNGEILWSAGHWNLIRWNTSRRLDGENGDPNGPSIGPPVDDRNWAGQDSDLTRGFCLDKENNVWNTGYDYDLSNHYVVKYDKDGTFLGQYSLLDSGECVVDAREGGSNDIWISRGSSCLIDHLKNDGTLVGTVDLGCTCGGVYNVAVDAKGKIWAVSCDSAIYRIDPTLGDLVGSTNVGAIDLTLPFGGGYASGDMTGSTLRSAPTTGTWRVMIDRINTNFDWNFTTVSWNAFVPLRTTLTVTASSSNDGTLFTAPKSVLKGSQLNSTTIPVGRYLQIQFLFKRIRRHLRSPLLHDLKVVSTNS